MVELGENPWKLKTEKEQYFSALWVKQRRTLTSDQKNSIGVAYLKHIIGVDEKTAGAFCKEESPENWSASHSVGVVQAGIKPHKDDSTNFWREVVEIAPDVYSNEDLEWLINEAG